MPGAVGAGKHVVTRQQRHRARSHIGKNESGHDLNRIGRLHNPVLVCGVRRFSGWLDAFSIRIVEPTVVWTTDVTAFDSAVGKRRAAMRAPFRHQTTTSFLAAVE